LLFISNRPSIDEGRSDLVDYPIILIPHPKCLYHIQVTLSEYRLLGPRLFYRKTWAYHLQGWSWQSEYAIIWIFLQLSQEDILIMGFHATWRYLGLFLRFLWYHSNYEQWCLQVKEKYGVSESDTVKFGHFWQSQAIFSRAIP